MYIVNILLNNTDLLLNVFYISTIFCGVSILIHKNAIISIVYFMLVYVNSSLYLYYTGYNGMPLLLILIYVGAIAILFLFILTLINVKEQEDQYRYSTRSTHSGNNLIIFITLLSIFILYIYNYCKDIIVGSQLYNILDKILMFNNEDINLINTEGQVYFNIPVLDYPISSSSEVMIIGQSMYTTNSILLLLLGIVLVLSIIAAIAILYTTHSCLVKTNK